MAGIKDLIENPNPIYKNNVNYWNFLLNSYEGGQDYIGMDYSSTHQIFAGGREVKKDNSTHMFQFKKERNDDYKSRIQYSYYYNFCSPIVDIYTNHLFKKPLIEDWTGIESVIENRWENIDKMNNSIPEFRKEIADLSQIYGHVFAMVDTPKIDGGMVSLQDKIDKDGFAYAVLKHPQDVINWSLDEFGNPYWVLVRESFDANVNPFAYDKDKRCLHNYRLWDRMNWYLFDGEGTQLDTGIHNLGIVPITVFYNKKSKKNANFLGISAIGDISFIARDVYNSCSELRQILREQTFATLTLQGESSDYNETEVGTNRGLLYPKETNQPQYISPPSSNAESYFKHIDRQISAMFRLAKLEGASAKFQGNETAEQSGISKAFDFNETNQTLSDKAKNMEDGEAKLWNIFAAWEGSTFEGHTSYPEDFNVQSLNQDLDEAEKSLKLNIGKEFNKEIKKAIIQKKFSRLNDNDIDRIVKDMESSEGTSASGRLVDRVLPALNKTSNQTA